jgi:hypothetical protein
MTDMTPYTPLKRMVAYALDEVEKSEADFDRCWILAFRAITLMNFQVAGQTVTVRLPVLGNKTVPLPANCLSWTKIGILDDRGQINTLRINNALTTFRDNNPNRLEDLTPNINTSIGSLALVPYYSNYYYGGGCYQLYGIGNGVITYGDCKVDEANRVIILNIDFKYDSIMLEFIDCPEKNNDYEFFTCLQEAVIAFIKWKLKLGSREEFYAAVTEGRRSLPKKKVELQSINQIIRESEGFKLRS